MANVMMTDTELRQRKAKAILAVKFETIEIGSLAYYRALGDIDFSF